MPQFSWYKYPEKAEHLTFGEIFVDLYQQTDRANHRFTTRILRSMTECMPPESSTDRWAPSEHQSLSRSLGDFLKLLGNSCDDDSMSQLCHLTNQVDVHDSRELGSSEALNVIEKAMLFSMGP
jgi:hypothetical protein